MRANFRSISFSALLVIFFSQAAAQAASTYTCTSHEVDSVRTLTVVGSGKSATVLLQTGSAPQVEYHFVKSIVEDNSSIFAARPDGQVVTIDDALLAGADSGHIFPSDDDSLVTYRCKK